MAITRERLISALKEKYTEELEGVESYEALIAELHKVFPRDFVLHELLDDLYKIVADEEIHAEVLKRAYDTLKTRI